MASARKVMVAHDLQGRDIKDKAVLEAMGKVPRHLFVPGALMSRAYADYPLPIGKGQTISQPYLKHPVSGPWRYGLGHHGDNIGLGDGLALAYGQGVVCIGPAHERT
ncbi:MAG TPA: hypothetical protein ENI12_06805, partial [Nitrospirae bacterium]|nr:hypothetical protein [Nitrospirota bacterium]